MSNDCSNHAGGRVRKRIEKRLLDLTLIFLTLPVSLPMLGVIAVLTWAIQGSPVLFKQQRPGLGCRPFTIYKFRTMRQWLGCNWESDRERLTRFGKFLRGTSLDELPELFNVIKGEMSLVGPRPLLMEYLEYYTPEVRRQHDVLPGMTGWAQINGRNTTTWERRFSLDLWYVDHQSLALDIKILFSTLWKVMMRDGVVQPGSPLSMENFKGFCEDQNNLLNEDTGVIENDSARIRTMHRAQVR